MSRGVVHVQEEERAVMEYATVKPVGRIGLWNSNSDVSVSEQELVRRG